MSKKNDNIVTALNDMVGEMNVENLVLYKGKGKKKQVDDEVTLANIEYNLAYTKGVIDGADVASNGELADEIADMKQRFNDFYNSALEMYEDEISTFSDVALVDPYDDVDEAGEGEDEIDLESMSLKELKALAKENGIKVAPRVDKDTLIEELSEVLYGDDEDADEADEADIDEEADDEVDEADEDEIDLEGMSLGELRKLAKQNGIKYTPKTKKEELIEWLEEALADEDADEADEGDTDEDEADEDEIDLESMSLKELKAFAKENGVKVTPKMKKDDIIEAIEELMADEGDEDADEADEGDTDEDDDDISEEELDEVLDEEFEDETIAEEEEKAVVKKGKKLPPRKNKR